MNWRHPKTSERVLLLGKTGSGKSQFGMHLLSSQPFDAMPYVIFDFKHDRMFEDIRRIRFVDDWKAPNEPGLYILRPNPIGDEERIDRFLTTVLRSERTGLFLDEGMRISPYSKPMAAIYTQGRSKHIPVITLSQRPSQISRLAVSESEHFGYFGLTDKRDHDTIRGFVPSNKFWNFAERLPKYHLRWHSVADDADWLLAPAPEIGNILDRIETRLRPKVRFY